MSFRNHSHTPSDANVMQEDEAAAAAAQGAGGVPAAGAGTREPSPAMSELGDGTRTPAEGEPDGRIYDTVSPMAASSSTGAAQARAVRLPKQRGPTVAIDSLLATPTQSSRYGRSRERPLERTSQPAASHLIHTPPGLA